MMSIWLADVNGRVVRTIVTKNFGMFLRRIVELMMFAVPASTINSALDYYVKQLALRFRARLTRHFHQHYLRNMNFYKICNLDSRITNPDQRLTADTEKWSDSLAILFVNIPKPILDIMMFGRALLKSVGWGGPILAAAWYGFTGLVIKNISPPFGKLTAVEQKLEGEYRGLH